MLARVDVTPGQEMLHVVTGTGNIALVAAAAGAQVVGLDLTPEGVQFAPRHEVVAREHAGVPAGPCRAYLTLPDEGDAVESARER